MTTRIAIAFMPMSVCHGVFLPGEHGGIMLNADDGEVEQRCALAIALAHAESSSRLTELQAEAIAGRRLVTPRAMKRAIRHADSFTDLAELLHVTERMLLHVIRDLGDTYTPEP